MSYKPEADTLLYGGPGAGKTALAVSSIWNWKEKKLVVPNGKIITFGIEDNIALDIPEECRHTEKGTSLRLTSPLLDSQEFISRFDLLTRRFLQDAKEGHPLDVLVIDGFSEFDLLYEATYTGQTGDEGTFGKWNGLLTQMFACMMRANHEAMRCPIISTARVMEKKKARTSKTGSTVPGDPGYMDFDYYPSMRGSFRLQMPHYFNLVLYMETALATQTGPDGKVRVVPAHVTNLVKNGDFYVKNHWEHGWLEREAGTQVVNAMWPDLWNRIVGVENG